MGYSLVPFCLFTWEKWIKVLKDSNLWGGGGSGRWRKQVTFSILSFAGIPVYLFFRPHIILLITACNALSAKNICATESRVIAKR